MVKRKIKKEASSESEGTSDSEKEQSDTVLSDCPEPPVTPRKSKRINKTSSASPFKSTKKSSSNVSFSPSPEAKSPKKRKQILDLSSTTPSSKSSPTKRPNLARPIVLIQSKKKILSKSLAKNADSDNSKNDESNDETDDETVDECEDPGDESEEEEEEEEEAETDSQNEDFLDLEATKLLMSNLGKMQRFRSNQKRQKIVDAAIGNALKSKAKAGQGNNNKKSTSKDTEVYLEDLTKDPVITRPKLRSCQLFDKDLVDIFLAKTYKNLPKLPSGYTNNRYLPAGEAPEPMMYISELLPGLSKISKKYLLELFTFVSDNGTSTVNLSRIEPCDLIAKKPDTGSIYPLVFLRHQKTPALCLSIISVDENYTRHPKDINGSSYKILTGVIQTMEYERLIATLCLVYKVPGIKTLMTNNRWSFSSRPGSSNGNSQNTYNRPTSFRSAGSKKLSPANTRQPQSQGSRWKIGYTSDENIPILDGRSIQIELPKGLRKVVKTLPAFTEEIPPGSLTLVGYTTLGYNSKKSPDELTIGTNICWAVVLATPKA
ncbi:hypothetical protein GALMADRAFT_144962 [Galerina marginata CBS 339.88]|uniref:Uncharacterized protein n=1 Tax=Galerina marginata (strain CBS 339.88) TaxID=685588 RepID=A0A067SU52_GALM3|nr:hypothetical protein GALMADRAFT_144962 [Galerina marginata CBS 339.88]